MQSPAYMISRSPAAFGRIHPAGQSSTGYQGAVAVGSTVAGAFGSPFEAAALEASGGLITGGTAGNLSQPVSNPDQITDQYGNPLESSSMAGKPITSQETAVFNTVAGALNTTGQTITQIVASGDQVRIAELNSNAQTAVAQLRAQAAQDLASGNAALAAQRQQQAQQLQMFQTLLAQRQQPANMALWIIGGLAALGIVGGAIYLAMSAKHGHANPRNEQRYSVGEYRFASLQSAEKFARHVVRSGDWQRAVVEDHHTGRAVSGWARFPETGRRAVRIAV